MRATRLFVPGLCLAVLSTFAPRSSNAAEPGCSRWDIEASCRTSLPKVVIGDAFTATITAKNTGDLALTNVTLDLRGDLGARLADGQSAPKTVIERLEPGETKTLTASFACDSVGITRVIGRAHDSIGWAVSSCACTVEVIGLPAIHSDMSDKNLSGKDEGLFHLGDSFLYVLEISNRGGTGVTPDLKATFRLPPELEFVSGVTEEGATITGSGQSAETSMFVLAPDQARKITITVKVTAYPPATAGSLVKTRATIVTSSGYEIADETESTTIKTPIGEGVPPAGR